jgi:outer membrane lipoprotein carrier protein
MRRRDLVRVALLCACAPAVVMAASADTALDRFLAGLSTWSASFSQTVVDPRGMLVSRADGRLVLVRPGRFRWEIDPRDAAQSGQLLVADGRNLWFLDRDLDQVTVKPMDRALSQSPAMLLSGTASVRDAFEVEAGGRAEGLDWVKATPRQKDADFRVARFGFDGNDLRRMVLEDKLGQKVTLVFSAAVRNRSVDAGSVAFTPPAGVDVIGTPVR